MLTAAQVTDCESGNKTEAKYYYDAAGRRQAKTVIEYEGIRKTGETTTEYYWYGDKVQYEQVTKAEGTDRKVNLWGLSGLAARNDEVYSTDGHGSVDAAYDGEEQIREYEYDAYGNELTENEGDENPYRYCSENTDKETGLIYLRNRYYDPELGRFLTEDPAQDGLNWYVYCGNNPVMFVDPSGYITEKERDRFNNGTLSLGAYSYLMWCTYNYYLADTDAERQIWNGAADEFRASGYTDAGDGAWNAVINNNIQTRPSGETVSMEEHFFRNELNLEFSYADLMKLNERLPDNMKWETVVATLHQNNTVNGKENIKYVSADGHFEIVYNGYNEIQNQYNNPDDMGTYNYYSPTTEAVQHGIYDVIPYWQYGNVYTPDKVVFIL